MVGQMLRARREAMGLDLRNISDGLKIRFDYLKAIEDGDFEKLPAEVYTRGYIQEYAKILDIEPATAIEAYTHQSADTRAIRDATGAKEDKVGKRFRVGYVMVPLVLVVLIIVGSLRILSPVEKTTLPPPPHAPPIKTKEVSPEAPGPALDLKALATETTWLLITVDNSEPKEILMKPGDSITWHADHGFSLKIGNAGGVRLVLNGKEMEPLGARGQVIKIQLPAAGRQ